MAKLELTDEQLKAFEKAIKAATCDDQPITGDSLPIIPDDDLKDCVFSGPYTLEKPEGEGGIKQFYFLESMPKRK